MEPSSSLAAVGAEGILQDAVETFYHHVRLQVVGSVLAVLDVEQAAEGGPQGEVNWVLRSDVLTALKQSTVEVAAIGMASGQREVLSMIVNR